MLYTIAFLLLKTTRFQPSQNAITYWLNTGAAKKLEYALTYGNYRTRRLAAEALEQAGTVASIPALLVAMNDKVPNVSVAALNALERLANEDYSLLKTVVRKRFYWVNKRRERLAKQAANASKRYTIYRWERASKKSFERVKEQLKRPIR